ncbi:rab3 GTPase-activating protein non-catalytic subunit [Topomyia yanbarensis]|uniref:rab3 GTPase-activating protein non-catalytic subunit n=1 Tax=Topomyia yanbarensis TaxID=2498891 RepID=UPI00273BA204|nr:rab3 GTPase-activating protein non-catalytic subunit [Topomyia yanbarensis]
MSCEVKLLANVDDLREVQEQFGLSSEENWLNAVSYSLSPAGDILAFGHGSILVILTSKWDRQRQLNVYKIAWKGAIDDPNCLITSVLCTPLVGQGSSQTSVDYSYIIVGLDSGQVLFYGENGTLVHSQLFHQEPVQAIKAQSGKHINEEVYVFHGSCVVMIQGSQLFPLLRSLKQQISRYGPGSARVNEAQEGIACRKWNYGKNITVQDAAVVGPQKTCTFDHLLTASVEGGFFAKYRHAPPQNSLIVAAGTKPYVGFHYAKEGFAQPVLADVARAVASKIKSALPSWFGGSSTPQAPAEPQLPPSEPLVCRFGLCDLQRTAYSVWVAPNFILAAVADNLGRVILVDCTKGIALRIWKGYRDAQCGFVEVTEKLAKDSGTTTTTKQDRRKAMFLVIYAPRRSMLEVWSLQNGPKVAAFAAAKNGQLIYNTHSFMGVSSGNSKVKYGGQGCTFFDPSDFSLKEISIPFHCALSDSKSKTAKDLHLLKRLKICLKSGDGSELEEQQEEIEMFRSFETDEIKLQCVEMLAKHRKIRARLFLRAVEIFGGFDEEVETLVSEEEHRVSHLRSVCENYRKLTMFYLFLTGERDVSEPEIACEKSVPSEETTESGEGEERKDSEEISLKNSAVDTAEEVVKLSELELASIEKLLAMNGSLEGPVPTRVTFEDSTAKSNTFQEYLSYFNVSNEGLILLKENSTSLYSSLGKIIFEEVYQSSQARLAGFVLAASASEIIHEDLLKLFLAFWLRLPFAYRDIAELVEGLNKFNQVLRRICQLAKDKIRYENNTICLWWQNAREYLLESPCALRGLLAAIMCRNEALKYEESSDEEDYQFEEVSQEACQWTLLIGELDDVAVLGTILSECLKCSNVIYPCLKYQKPDVSLKEILKGGQGIVAEMVAKWVAASGIDPEKLVIEIPDEAVENEQAGVQEPAASERKERKRLQMIKQDLLQTSEYGGSIESELDPLLYNLSILRRHFPFSLDSGTLLCHLAWEYICDWSKNMANISCLSAGLACLKAVPRLQHSMKHGLCCMIWNAHLKIPLEATRKLVNKVGRLPKEKLCLQDIGISDALVPQFLENCLEFLDHFSQSIDHDKLELRFEELLQDGPIPLTALAIQQNAANMALLKLHHELATVLLILTSFNVKYQKPIQQFFDGMANQSFFAEINRQLPYTLPKADLLLKRARFEFLCKTITASMDLIREDLENVFYTEHIAWMERIEQLSEVWEISTTELKKHQIVELYSHGWDTYAEELLENIVPDQALGNLLLAIAGRRLAIYTKANPRVWSQVAAVGPLLTDYLDTLISSENHGPQLRFAEGNDAANASGEISIGKLSKLVEKAFRCLTSSSTAAATMTTATAMTAGTAAPPTASSNRNSSSNKTKELRIAGLLFDACATIKELSTGNESSNGNSSNMKRTNNREDFETTPNQKKTKLSLA